MPELHENYAQIVRGIRFSLFFSSSVSHDVWLKVTNTAERSPSAAAVILAQAELIDQFAWRGYICWGYWQD